MATKVAIPSLEALVRLTFLQKAKGLPLSLFCFQKYCVFITCHFCIVLYNIIPMQKRAHSYGAFFTDTAPF